MGKRFTGRTASGCNSSATCEHAPGIVCLFCARARSRTETVPAPRTTPSGIKDACLEMCSRFHNLCIKTSKTMYYEDKINDLPSEDTVPDTCEPLTKDLLAGTPTAFITKAQTTCGARHCGARNYLSYQKSYKRTPSLSPHSLVALSPQVFDRHGGYCEMMSSRVHFRIHKSSEWLKTGIYLVLLLASLSRPAMATMDITAFEYQRKFHKPLDLGECSQREVAVDMGNNTIYIEEQRCTLHQRGIVTHLPRELNDSRNVLIPSADGIVAYLGLCGGEAASFLGILNSGDCVAVEIASRLTFSEKTMVRAFVGYYRKSLDILEGGQSTVEGMDRYYKDKFYLKNRSYGTLEIIFVQLRFESVVDTEEARKIELSTPVMSKYMRQIQKQIGIPKNTVVISLSTATQETYELKQFKKEDWERAVRYVEILELTIQKTRDLINSNIITPHLQYQLHPFMDSGGFRLTKPVLWEKTSMLEVKLRQAITLAKKTAKKCRGNPTKLCRRVRELKRKLESAQVEIHKGRSNWVTLTAEEKNLFATRYTARVNSYSNVTKTLAKSVREMKNKEKLEKLERKKNRLNQIPVVTEGHPPKRQHRIRHARSRSKSRRGQGS